MKPIRDRWDKIHEVSGFRPAYPHDEVVRWAKRILGQKNPQKQRVLDHGCGSGRHAVFFATLGFETFACDFSAPGLLSLRDEATRLGLEVHTTTCPGDDLSAYESNSFDAVLSFGVLYYMGIDTARRAISDINRVLKPGGSLMCVVRTDEDSRCKGSKKIGPYTWRLGGLVDPHAPASMENEMDMLFFSEADVRELFSQFSTVRVDRMTITRDGFTDDDWLVMARK